MGAMLAAALDSEQIQMVGLLDWLRLRDYDQALQEARVAVIKRFARGNVSFQNGNLLDDVALDELRAKGDRAAAHLIAQKLLAEKDARNYGIPRSTRKDTERVG